MNDRAELWTRYMGAQTPGEYAARGGWSMARLLSDLTDRATDPTDSMTAAEIVTVGHELAGYLEELGLPMRDTSPRGILRAIWDRRASTHELGGGYTVFLDADLCAAIRVALRED